MILILKYFKISGYWKICMLHTHTHTILLCGKIYSLTSHPLEHWNYRGAPPCPEILSFIESESFEYVTSQSTY